MRVLCLLSLIVLIAAGCQSPASIANRQSPAPITSPTPKYKADLGVRPTPWGPVHVFDKLSPAIAVPPNYPMRARDTRRTGEVVALVLVNSAGEVEDVRVQVSSGDDSLDRAAIAALRKWTFHRDFRPDRYATIQNIVFAISD